MPLRVIPAVLVAVVLAVGCSSSSGSADALEQAVRSYSAAFLSRQGEKAAGMLSARCSTPALHAQIVQASAAAPALYGQARLVAVQPTIDGDHAKVTYRFDQPAIDQENQPWAWENGAWRYDQC
jgi:hypothetical protein